jgi:hypothetical protein
MCIPSRYLATIMGIHMQTHRLMGGIYGVSHWQKGPGAMIYTYTKIHRDYFRHSKADRWDAQIHREEGDGVSLQLFFRNRESALEHSISTRHQQNPSFEPMLSQLNPVHIFIFCQIHFNFIQQATPGFPLSIKSMNHNFKSISSVHYLMALYLISVISVREEGWLWSSSPCTCL